MAIEKCPGGYRAFPGGRCITGPNSRARAAAIARQREKRELDPSVPEDRAKLEDITDQVLGLSDGELVRLLGASLYTGEEPATRGALEDLLEAVDDGLGDEIEDLLALAAGPVDVSKVVAPRSGEKRSAFISRCMSAEQDAFPDREQRLAVCFSKFRARKKDEACCDGCAEGGPCARTKGEFEGHFPGRIVRKDEELQLVTAEVYIPDFPDAQGDFMTAVEIRKMAHLFVGEGRTGQVDVNHDNDTTRGLRVVESFIARKNDPDFIEGSWVVTIHCADTTIWQAVKKGELNGLSMQAEVFVREKTIDVDIPQEVSGQTFEASNGSLHSHGFTVRFDADGNFEGGITTITDGHRHEIRSRSVTEPGGADGHRHRFSFIDKVIGPSRDPGSFQDEGR